MTSSPERAEDLLYALLRGDRPDPRSDDTPFSLTLGTVTSRCRTDRGVLLPDPAYPGTHWHCSERLAGLYRAAYITVHEALAAPASSRVMMHAATVARLRTILLDAGEQAIREDGEFYVPDDSPGAAPSLVEDFLRLERACLGDLADLGHRDALVRVAEISEGCVGSGLPHFSVMAHGIRLFLCGSGFHPVHRPGALARARALGLDAHRDAARLLAVHDEPEETDAEVIAEDRAGIRRLPVSTPKPKAPAAAGRTLVVFPRLDHLPQPNKLARERADSPRALCEDLVEVPLPLAPAPDPAVFAAGLEAAFPWADEVTEQYALDLVGAPFAMVRPRTLVGGAGGGKTSYARAVFRGLGLPEVIHSAAGQIDGGAFAGTNRMWGTWRLSVVAQAIQRFRTASVGVLVDEAEKQGPSRRWGRLDETILPFLERSTTARAIQDPALEVPLDLSGPSYILTANDRTGLSQPLLDRAPPVQWPMPRREHMPVAAAAILAEIRQERGLDEAWCPPLDGNELDALSAWRGGSLRPLRRMVQAVLASREQFARLQPN